MRARTVSEASWDADFCSSSTPIGASVSDRVSAAAGREAVADAVFSFACVMGAFAIRVDFDFDLAYG